MLSRNRIVAWVFVTIGASLAAFLSRSTLLAADTVVVLAVVGGVLLYVGILWEDAIGSQSRDERAARIHYRSGYNAALAMAVGIETAVVAFANGAADAPLTAFGLILLVGFLAYGVSIVRYEQVV